MKKQTKDEEVEKIKKLLPRTGAYKIIEGMLNGTYKANTIKAMFNQQRTMKDEVLEAAKKLIKIMNPSNQQGL